MSIQEISLLLRARMGRRGCARADQGHTRLDGAARVAFQHPALAQVVSELGKVKRITNEKARRVSGLVAALERGCHRRDRREPGAAWNCFAIQADGHARASEQAGQLLCFANASRASLISGLPRFVGARTNRQQFAKILLTRIAAPAELPCMRRSV